MRLLIVDDSVLVREQLAAMLSENLEGIEIVGQARNAQEGIQSVRSLRPDAMILDIRMPGGTGIDVLREVKRCSPAPIVMIFTNYPSPEHREMCKAAGADFFFNKSADLDRMVKVFQGLIRSSRPD